MKNIVTELNLISGNQRDNNMAIFQNLHMTYQR